LKKITCISNEFLARFYSEYVSQYLACAHYCIYVKSAVKPQATNQHIIVSEWAVRHISFRRNFFIPYLRQLFSCHDVGQAL